jgi:hypothetical protein
MIKNIRRTFLMGTVRVALLTGTFVVLSAVWSPSILGQTAKTSARAFAATEAVQQPLYAEYKGVRLGMTDQEVHAKLGPALKIDDQDFYVFSDTETAQIAYDASRKVTAISVDYVGGVGAPDYKNVVGPSIDIRPDGSMYKIVHYDQLGFWVSYNRTGRNSAVSTVSITIQRLPR